MAHVVHGYIWGTPEEEMQAAVETNDLDKTQSAKKRVAYCRRDLTGDWWGYCLC
jgi:hypothetical protein